MPNQSFVAFDWFFRHALPRLLGTHTCAAMALILADDWPSTHHAIQTAKNMGVMPHVVDWALCAYHALYRKFDTTVAGRWSIAVKRRTDLLPRELTAKAKQRQRVTGNKREKPETPNRVVIRASLLRSAQGGRNRRTKPLI
jgi:hypothetical protein